jgi:hypothetical protein
MTKKIKYETTGESSSRILEVEFTIFADSDVDAYGIIDSLFDVHDKVEVPIEDISKEELGLIETLIDDVAYMHAFEAWHEQRLSKADYWD